MYAICDQNDGVASTPGAVLTSEQERMKLSQS